MKRDERSNINGWLVRTTLAALILFSATSISYGQAVFQTRASGNWTTAATWTKISGGGARTSPGTTDTAIVTSPYQVTVSANSDCASMRVNAGGTVLINTTNRYLRINGNPGYALVYGTVRMTSTARIMEATATTGTRSLILGSGGDLVISGNATNPTFDIFSFDPASTVEYTYAGTQTVLSGVTYGNLTIGGSGTKTVGPLPADSSFRSAGTITVGAGTTFDVSSHILYVTFGGNVINQGTIDASHGTSVVTMTGASWVNNGTYLASTTAGFGITPVTRFVNTTLSGTPVAQAFWAVSFEGTSTLSSNLVVRKGLTIAPGATLNGGTGTSLQIGGDWVNNGTYAPGTSTVTFTDTVAQNISGSSFHNVVINNAKGVTLAGNSSTDATGTLTLTSGNVNTEGYALTVNSTNPAAVTLGSNTITGSVTRSIAAGSTATYTFTNANTFVIPSGVGNPATISMIAYPNTNPPDLGLNADTGMIVKRYYTIWSSGPGAGFTFTLRLSYQQSEVRGFEPNYSLWENSGSGWVNMGFSTLPDTMNNYVQQFMLAGFSNWTIAEGNAALPVQLASFNAAMATGASNVQVSWTTISEINSYGFYIERSTGSPDAFVSLPDNFVAGHVRSLSTIHYTWSDKAVMPGTYYYRLKQVDLDGSSSYSEAVKVIVENVMNVNGRDGKAEVFALGQNYPNPFNPTTTIQFSVRKSGRAMLQVFNVLGQEVATLFSGVAQSGTTYTVAFDGTHLANGAYFYKLTSGSETLLKKMLMVK